MKQYLITSLFFIGNVIAAAVVVVIIYLIFDFIVLKMTGKTISRRFIERLNK